MKKVIILLLALAAAIASGFAVLHQFALKIDTPSGSSSSSSSSETTMEFFESSASSVVEELTTTIQVDAEVSGEGMLLEEDTPSSSAASLDSARRDSAAYAAFIPGVIGNGETSVLFFHDKTSEDSLAADRIVKNLFLSSSAELPVYRIDAGTNTAILKKYNVTASPTFVKINGSGDVISTSVNPTTEELKTLVQ